MGFTVAVWSNVCQPFGIFIEHGSTIALDLKRLIENSKTGDDMGFVAGKWLLFPATEDGKKMGSDPFGHVVPIAPSSGSSIVNVWVEPMAPTTAGEALHDECGSPRPRTANVARSSFLSASFPPPSQRRRRRRSPGR